MSRNQAYCWRRWRATAAVHGPPWSGEAGRESLGL